VTSRRRCTARIVSRTGTPVQRIVLEMPEWFRFRAGQYLTVEHPGGGIPLSIASAPRRLPILHLHYRSTPGNADAAGLDGLLERGDPLKISGPAGSVSIDAASRSPILLAAGGTGMAQVFGLLDELSVRPERADVAVLWCADRESDFYLREELAASGATVTTIADPARGPDNAGLRWLAREAGRFRQPCSQVVLSGSPAFAYAAADTLTAAGVPEAHLQSDVFAYAPRPGSGSGGSSRSA
jgi:CDP-4-dehydro-6-deoxyglucose reductase, E3